MTHDSQHVVWGAGHLVSGYVKQHLPIMLVNHLSMENDASKALTKGQSCLLLGLTAQFFTFSAEQEFITKGTKEYMYLMFYDKTLMSGVLNESCCVHCCLIACPAFALRLCEPMMWNLNLNSSELASERSSWPKLAVSSSIFKHTCCSSARNINKSV